MTAGHHPATPVEDTDGTRVIWLLVGSAFVMILNETIILVALPAVIADLGVPVTTAQWLTSGFLLTMAVVIPITGFLLQRFPPRGVYLTSMALLHPKVRAGMAISGIYDLEPIRHSYLNEKLRADEATSRRNSPMMQQGGPLKPLSLVVGSAELPLLRKQTADFAGYRARYGLPVTYEEIPGANHFTIMQEMMSPKGRITALIRQLFERTT